MLNHGDMIVGISLFPKIHGDVIDGRATFESYSRLKSIFAFAILGTDRFFDIIFICNHYLRFGQHLSHLLGHTGPGGGVGGTSDKFTILGSGLTPSDQPLHLDTFFFGLFLSLISILHSQHFFVSLLSVSNLGRRPQSRALTLWRGGSDSTPPPQSFPCCPATKTPAGLV